MAQKTLSVKFNTEGFQQAISNLQQTGKSFESVLKNAQDASKRASEALAKARQAGDVKGEVEAQKQLEKAAKDSSRAIAQSYKQLGVDSSESINKLKAQAVSAFEAIKNSGTASAQDIARAQDALNNKIKDLDSRLTGVTKTTVSFGEQAKLAFGALSIAFGAYLGKSLEAGKATDSAVAKISTLTGSSKDLYKELEGLSKELNYQQKASDLANAGYDVLSAGFSKTSDVTQILRASVKGATGGFGELGVVSDGLTSILNAYGRSADDAGKITDQLITVQNDGKITLGQYAQQIGGVASIAAAGGVKLEELNAVIASSTAAGVKVESAFSGTRSAISAIIKPSTEAAKLAEQLGIQFNSAGLKQLGFAGILDQVRQKAGGNNQALATLFGSVEALAAIQPVLSNFEKFEQFLKNQATAAGAADAAYQKVSGSLAGTQASLEGLNNQIQNKVFEAFAPLVNAAAQAAVALGKAFLGLPDVVQKIIIGLTALASGIAAVSAGLAGLSLVGISVSGVFAAFLGSITAVATALSGALVSALGLLLSPIGLVVAAIAALIAGLVLAYQKSEGFRDAVNFLGEVLKIVAADAFQAITQAVKGLGDWLKNVGNGIKSFADNVGKNLNVALQNIASFGNSTIQFFTDIFNWINSIDLFKGVITSAQNAARQVKSAFSGIQDTPVGNFLSDGPLGLLGLKPITAVRDYVGGLFGRVNNQRSAEATDQSNLNSLSSPAAAPKLQLPTLRTPQISTSQPSSGGSGSGSGANPRQEKEKEYYQFPVARPTQGEVTSGFGARKAPRKGASTFHDGIDINAQVGSDVIAPLPGKVTGAGFDNNGGGNFVKIQSFDQLGRKIEQTFMHLSQILVGVGETVKQGDLIAKSGNTGISTGAHLHWRTRINGTPVDPREFEKMQFSLPAGEGKPSDYLRSQAKKAPTSEQSLIQGIISLSQKLGINPEDLLKSMLLETGGTLSPKPHGNGAVGLIGFTGDNQKELGVTLAQLGKMTAEQQLPYVQKYLEIHSRGQKIDSFQKLASTIYGGNPNVPLTGKPDGSLSLGTYIDRANSRYGDKARNLISSVDKPLAENIKFQEQEQTQAEKDIQSNRQKEIEDLKSQQVRIGETQRQDLERQFADGKFSYQQKILNAESDIQKQNLEQESKLYNLQSEQIIKQFDASQKIKVIDAELAILNQDKASLTEEEVKKIKDLNYEKKKILDISKADNLEAERAIFLAQDEFNISRQKAVEELRNKTKGLGSQIAEMGLNEAQKAIAQDNAQYESLFSEILKQADLAASLGATSEAERLKEILAQVTALQEKSLNNKAEEINKSIKLQELTDEQRQQYEALQAVQDRFDKSRLEIEALLADARAKGLGDSVKLLEDLSSRNELLRQKQLEAVRQQFDEIQQIFRNVEQASKQALEGFFEDIFTGTKSLGDAFNSFITSILKTLASIAAQNVVKGIFKFVGLGFADGGLVSGPGSGTSDSIPARLSNGEFVMRANAVKYWGSNFLDELNGLRSPTLNNLAFAGASGGTGSSRGNSQIINVNVSTPDANSFRKSEGQLGRDAAEQLRRNAQRNG